MTSSRRPEPPRLSLINQAIDTLEAYLTEPLDIAEIAVRVGYSRFHFDRLFLTAVGETPTRYLRQRRLSEAARQLIVTRQPILEIALKHQFGSAEAFSRAFRRRFGLSPRDYRRRGHLKRFAPRIFLKTRPIEIVRFEHISLAYCFWPGVGCYRES